MAQQSQTQKGTTAKKQGAGKTMMESMETAAGAAPAQAERHRMISEEAYRIAERRGFQGDLAMDDWLQAEATINARFEAKH